MKKFVLAALTVAVSQAAFAIEAGQLNSIPGVGTVVTAIPDPRGEMPSVPSLPTAPGGSGNPPAFVTTLGGLAELANIIKAPGTPTTPIIGGETGATPGPETVIGPLTQLGQSGVLVGGALRAAIEGGLNVAAQQIVVNALTAATEVNKQAAAGLAQYNAFAEATQGLPKLIQDSIAEGAAAFTGGDGNPADAFVNGINTFADAGSAVAQGVGGIGQQIPGIVGTFAGKAIADLSANGQALSTTFAQAVAGAVVNGVKSLAAAAPAMPGADPDAPTPAEQIADAFEEVALDALPALPLNQVGQINAISMQIANAGQGDGGPSAPALPGADQLGDLTDMLPAAPTADDLPPAPTAGDFAAVTDMLPPPPTAEDLPPAPTADDFADVTGPLQSAPTTIGGALMGLASNFPFPGNN